MTQCDLALVCWARFNSQWPHMLQINNLSYRIEGRPLFTAASVTIPSGHKVGLVGRNGTGKTTLLKLIIGDLAPDEGNISWPKSMRLGHVAQEAPGTDASLIEWVLAADTERAELLHEAQSATDPTRIADIQNRLTDIDAHVAPSRAARVLAGLGFDEAAQQRPCRAFSGGWRMRVALAAVLFLEPELLLLDEPTNYLDLEGTLWLENYLKGYPHTVVIVSHDRDLLNRCVNGIVHLDQGRLSFYAGGYDQFEEKRREQQRVQAKLKKKQDSERARIEAFIERFRAKATKATQAQSRVKALARLQPIAAEVDDHIAPISFPTPARELASPLISLEGAAVGYTAQTAILDNLNLRIDQDDRIALLGQNGNGKSTFAKLIANRLPVQRGDLISHQKLKVGYFAQHQLDELDGGHTPYHYIARLMPDAKEAEKRARLGAFGFGVEKADTPSARLSGGEKARLLLMLTAFDAPHLVILDEPTNHLDVDSREMLIRALNEYDGAVILISHDRHLVDACAERLWIVREGTVAPFDGDMEDYRRLLLEARGTGASKSSRNSTAASDETASSRAEQRRVAAERRKALAPLKSRIQESERAISKLQGKLGTIDAALADENLYSNEPQRAQELIKERGLLARQLDDAEEAWLSASEAYETAAGPD